ncbi:MAG: hypothetical protein HYR55_19345 [Acidobacteria bacterium]|nr:hypothetical protein [Acidobacteriota bacterium]MBI3656833.1 hypothetical protein [Acidobacteriota bacterium]
MKKMALAILFGCMFLTGSALAGVDCDAGFEACQVQDPERMDWQPVIRFMLLEAQTVHVVAPIWASPDCSGDPDAMVDGDVTFTEPGPAGIRIIFGDPLPDGTPLSMQWTLGACPATDCINYVLGPDGDPPACSGADESQVASLDANPIR